jgi:hypothetical protein
MPETKLPVGVISYLIGENRLFDPIATGLTILQFRVNGEVKFVAIKDVDLQSRGDDPAVAIEMEIDGKTISMIDSQFLQSLVVTEEHFAAMKNTVKHVYDYTVKGGKNEKFESMFFFEDVDEQGLRDADLMQPLHKALGLGEDTSDDADLSKLNLELVGVMVNRRRDDDVVLSDHNFPRAKAGSYPQYRTLREKFEENSAGDIYTIGMYTEDYEALHNKKPNINNVVNVARNWNFTPIFVDKSGNLLS